MTEDQLRDELDLWESVKYEMNEEGIEYCFRQQSDWREIQDEEFHLKREKLIELMVEMEEYVQQKITETEDKIIDLGDNNILG